MSDYKLNDIQRSLAEENESMIWKMINTYNLDADEWYGILANAYCKAAHDFIPNGKAKFKTVAIKYMKTAIMNEFRDRNLDKHKLECIDSDDVISLNSENTDNDKQLQEIIPDEKQSFDDVIHGKVDAEMVLSKVWDSLTDMQKRYVSALYDMIKNDGSFTQREIGERIGVTQQRSNEIKNQIKTKLIAMG